MIVKFPEEEIPDHLVDDYYKEIVNNFHCYEKRNASDEPRYFFIILAALVASAYFLSLGGVDSEFLLRVIGLGIGAIFLMLLQFFWFSRESDICSAYYAQLGLKIEKKVSSCGCVL